MSMSDDVVIVSAARTPVGSFNGAFATTPAHDLGAIAIRAALERAGIEPGRVSEVIMGQILTAAQGQNPARQASIAAGIPVESPAWGVNQLCGSGLRTVALGYQALLNGDSEIVVAGGQESMSMAPHAQYLRAGTKMGPIEFVDTMIKDGLWDAFNGYHMGNTAEKIHDRFPELTKERSDRYALRSQQKAAAAYEAGKFQPDLIPVAIRSDNGWGLATRDEALRPETTLEGLAGLKTPFRPHGRVTAGNSSGLNDGATVSLLASEATAKELGLPTKMRMVSFAFAGVEPEIMGIGPVPSTEKALKKAGLEISDIGLFELNEAFAVQVLSLLDHFGIDDEDPRVNQWGGAIAIGHPLASSGVRLMIQLAAQFAERPDVRFGLTAMCVGLGQGGSVIWENPLYTGKKK